MAINFDLNKQISPLDLNKNMAIGVAYPFDSTDDAVFRQSFTQKEALKANLFNLLLTEPGERVMEPTYGIGLKSLVFESDPDPEELKYRIHDAILIFIPDISLISVDTNFIEDQHILQVKIAYQILTNGDVDAIQVNYNSQTM